MSYTPTEWETADIVTAQRMNALETAVGDMNMSYTPNTWSDGDILSAAKMNALEQAVASGGGSSDLSTAEVTVTGNFLYNLEIKVPVTVEYEGTEYSASGIYDDGVYNVILYKGLCMGAIPTGNEAQSITVSGDIEIDEFFDLTITGNGTITIS